MAAAGVQIDAACVGEEQEIDTVIIWKRPVFDPAADMVGVQQYAAAISYGLGNTGLMVYKVQKSDAFLLLFVEATDSNQQVRVLDEKVIAPFSRKVSFESTCKSECSFSYGPLGMFSIDSADNVHALAAWTIDAKRRKVLKVAPAYRGSGQTQGKIEYQYVEGGRIVSLPFTLEKDVLDRKFNNYYVNQYTEQVEAFCKAKLLYRTVGKVYDGYEGACKCEKSDFYILITNYLSIDSPVTCGNCKNTVPLYKLPVYYDHGYWGFLRWESNYNSCDTLQMNCEVGERWALNQMQELKSQLSKQGLKICRKIEELTGIPVYYYLHNISPNS